MALLVVSSAPEAVWAKSGRARVEIDHRTGEVTPGTTRVEIDHQTGEVKPAGSIRLAAGDRLEIVVKNTETACFSFNLTEQLEPDPAGLRATELDFTDEVEFVVAHDPEVIAYAIEAALIATRPEDREACARLKPRTWTIRVRNIGWAVGFAGGFLADELTDPIFFLEEGTDPAAGDGGEEASQGFFVRRRSEAEDDFTLGTAAMIHLYRENTDGIRGSGVGWAPLSFGLGVTEGSDLRYFLGTGLRFGDQVFLTAGRVFGSRERLPNRLGIGDFTTDDNALDNLPSRTEDAWFVGISYTFLSNGVDQFLRNGLKIETPKPASKQSAPSSGPAPPATDQPAKATFTFDKESYEVTEGSPIELEIKLGSGTLPEEATVWIRIEEKALPWLQDLKESPVQVTVPIDGPGKVMWPTVGDDDENDPREFKIELLRAKDEDDPVQTAKVTILDDDKDPGDGSDDEDPDGGNDGSGDGGG